MAIFHLSLYNPALESIRTYKPGAYCVCELQAISIVCIGNGAIMEQWHRYVMEIQIFTKRIRSE